MFVEIFTQAAGRVGTGGGRERIIRWRSVAFLLLAGSGRLVCLAASEDGTSRRRFTRLSNPLTDAFWASGKFFQGKD
ncbi:hypothetical protein ZHAS_00009623 [Anopheles sinensis]|uniref:Uncharacterized protein n=1 Tax=Anopheles sinensis TaxID=74873 RepID=A0A084VVP7_ANOSI|nr:hypothetical protein ZHAS_00009623 [Anopheles sinensis]